MWFEIWKERKKVRQKADLNRGRSRQKKQAMTHTLTSAPLELTIINRTL